MIEVCTESSIQPLVQLFSIYAEVFGNDLSNASGEWSEAFDALVDKDFARLSQLLDNSNILLRVLSFLTSVASVAWSFQSNYARKKFGQMTIESRVVYFLYVLLAVNVRITIIITFLLAIKEQGD